MIATAKAQQREIDRLQLFVDRFRAKNTKAAQAQSKLKQIERIKEDMVDVPTARADGGFSFSAAAAQRPARDHAGKNQVRLRRTPADLRRHAGFRSAERDQRIVLVGPNGAGKSTLLKLLAEVLKPQSGEHKLGHNVKARLLRAASRAMLNPKHTVLQEALDTPQRVTEQAVRNVLGSFLFRGDDIYKPVSVLSGGEKSRLALVKLLLDPPNLLLMDEPTTHLDLASVDALIEALKQYEGTLFSSATMCISSARCPRTSCASRPGTLRHFGGGYQYYLDKTAQSARAALTSSSGAGSGAQKNDAPAVDRKEQRRLEAEERQARSRKKQAVQKRIAALEKEIGELEAKQHQLSAELEKPEAYAGGRAMQINRELMHVHDRLAAANTEWETANAELATGESTVP
jgi:ATP-binding cassette subfamily F protein 3